MILLVTAFATGRECSAELEQATGLVTHWAETLQLALARLRVHAYDAVVLDQFLLETEPEQAGLIQKHIGTATLVPLSFGISGMERLVREVRAALGRRKQEEGAVRLAVQSQMRSELSESLTALLLSCELALAVHGVPDAASDKIRQIDGLARKMCGSLGEA